MSDIQMVKAELAELRRQIRRYSKQYYDDNASDISDYEFDQLMLRLKAIEAEYPELITKNSPTQKVGGSAQRTAGVLVKHDVPMLSLQDVFSEAEIRDFVAGIRAHFPAAEFVVEEKIDGLSLALRYENGVLARAVTRGDGIVQGEDVTENARMIADVREQLSDAPVYFEVRGEVYMERAAFAAVNERQELLGLKLFANPRNCAAGTLRQLDARVTRERRLSMFVFNLQRTEGRTFASHTASYDFMRAQGIKIIAGYRVCRTADEVWAAIEEIGARRGRSSRTARIRKNMDTGKTLPLDESKTFLEQFVRFAGKADDDVGGNGNPRRRFSHLFQQTGKRRRIVRTVHRPQDGISSCLERQMQMAGEAPVALKQCEQLRRQLYRL